MLALLDGDGTRRDLRHADADERHEPDVCVVRFDEDDGPRCCRGDVALASRLTLPVRAVGFGEVFEERLGVVGSFLDEGLFDGAGDGTVPAVVAQRAEEGLVDCAADELGRERVESEHVEDRVGLAFEPEFVATFDVVCDVEGPRFARVGDYGVVVWGCDGTDAFSELAREEVVPRCEAVVFCTRVALVDLFELVGGPSLEVGSCCHFAQSRLAKPAVGVVA